MEYLLLKEVAFSHSKGRAVNLSPELERHLSECQKCRKSLPEWTERLKTLEPLPERVDGSSQ